MNNKITISLNKFNWLLFFMLILINLIPTIYTTVRIFFIGSMPSDWGFNIASQLSWVNVGYEIIQESIVLPLFYLIGNSINNKSNLENKLKTGLITSFIVYFVVSIFVFIFARKLLISMSQDSALLDASTAYIRLETIAISISILYKFILIFFISLNKIKELFILLLFQMFMSSLLDVFFVSQLPISYNLGVNGIAINNIIVNVILFILSIFMLKKDNIHIFSSGNLSFNWQKEWLKIGWISGLESFVRNFTFIVIILKMMNLVKEQGTFWVANNFIWGWLLIPVLALGDLIKRNISQDYKTAKTMFNCYFIITVLIILSWLITMPLWEIFIHKIMNIENYELVYHVVMISIIFYIIFAINNIIDSIFYGLGRTDLMLYQSLICNIAFFGTTFLLFKFNIFVPTLDKVAIMFGIGMSVDSFITFIMYAYLYKKDRLKPYSDI